MWHWYCSCVIVYMGFFRHFDWKIELWSSGGIDEKQIYWLINGSRFYIYICYLIEAFLKYPKWQWLVIFKCVGLKGVHFEARLWNALKCRNLQASIGTQGQQECNLANLNLNSKVETILLMDLESRIWYLSAVMQDLKCSNLQGQGRTRLQLVHKVNRSANLQI